MFFQCIRNSLFWGAVLVVASACSRTGPSAGTTVPQPESAIAEFRRLADACESGTTDACAEALNALRTAGLPSDPQELRRAARIAETKCKNGQLEDCRVVAASLAALDPSEATVEEEVTLRAALEALCPTEPVACTEHGIMAANGQGGPRDLAAAFKSSVTGCELGELVACYNVGVAFQRGLGADRAPMRALQYFSKACLGGYTPACQNLGVIHASGDLGPKDDALAAQFYERACVLGELKSCVDAGNRYVMGWGVKQDTKKGLQYVETACKGGDAYGCFMLGRYLVIGEVVPADHPRARRYLGQSCDAGDSRGCRELGDLLAKGPGIADPVAARVVDRRAEALMRKACFHDNHGRSCAWLAEMHREGRVEGIPGETPEALQKRACSLDNRECPER